MDSTEVKKEHAVRSMIATTIILFNYDPENDRRFFQCLEDLVNDTFEVLYEGNRRFDELSELRDFLFQTGKNICINHLKDQALTQKKYAEFGERRPYTEEDFYADISYSETRALIFKCIQALPAKLRLVFEMRYFDQLSNDAVAEELNIAIKTAYNRYSDARRQLKWDLEQIKRFTLYLLNLFI